MKKINLPMLDCDLCVFRKDERIGFEGRGVRLDDGDRGCSYDGAVWIGGDEGKRIEGVIVHELSHYVDWLLETRLEMKVSTLDSIGELRAYILEYLYPLVADYIMEEV